MCSNATHIGNENQSTMLSSRPSHASRSALGCQAIASSLHLDDLPEGSSNKKHASSGTNLHEIGAASLASADSKRREQIRLFKEYISCCQSTVSPLSSGGHYSSLSNLSMCDDNEGFGRSDSTTSMEYGSFLPKLNGPRNRQSPPGVAVSGLSALLPQAGRDTPAALPAQSCPSPVSAPQLKKNSSPGEKGKGSGASGAVMRRNSGRTSQASPALAQDEEACSVFKSQVAAALGAGRAVWL
jgi:hypothetical protein